VEKEHGPDSIEHPGNLLLPFLENQLMAEDRAMVQDHLKSCAECSSEFQMLDELLAKLKANKDIFCPEPHRLFDFAETGEDPEGRLARHLEHCPMCSRDVEAYRTGCQVDVLPEKVHAAYRDRFSHISTKSRDSTGDSLFAGLAEWLSSLLKAPTFALATAAAAILVVVLIYPREEIEPYIGLSSVAWKSVDDEFAPKSLIVEPRKPCVALLLSFKGFKERLDQRRVDALYQCLSPVVEAQEHTEVISPAEIQVILREKSHASDAKETFEYLGKNLNVSSVVILQIVSASDGFGIDGRTVEATTGETMRRKTLDAVPESQLPARLGETLGSLLETKPIAQ